MISEQHCQMVTTGSENPSEHDRDDVEHEAETLLALQRDDLSHEVAEHPQEVFCAHGLE
jgi:hypothetical protein